MSEHILSAYDEELNELRGIIVRMGELASDLLGDAMQALHQLDVEKAEKTRLADKELDQLEMTAERATVGLFARRAPVADDLREVLAALKMTSMIERMGDYAKNIAKRTIAIADGDAVMIPPALDDMATEARGMVQAVVDAYVHRSAEDALAVWERDQMLDAKYEEFYHKTLARMMEQPEHIPVLNHCLMIAKNIERIGDQATNVAEQVHYAITGRALEEARQKGDHTSSRLIG